MSDEIKVKDEGLESVSGGTVLPYLVQPGDSLRSIADKYHVPMELLMKWNHIQNPDIITVGQQLRILF
jgi:FOG: LysM repeat